MTEQEIYDTVKAHLLAQGERSTDLEEGACAYRGAGGLKCAVGCLITDEEYSPCAMEGMGVATVCRYVPRLAEFEELLGILQTVHDRMEPTMWENELAEVAMGRDLTP